MHILLIWLFVFCACLLCFTWYAIPREWYFLYWMWLCWINWLLIFDCQVQVPGLIFPCKPEYMIELVTCNYCGQSRLWWMKCRWFLMLALISSLNILLNARLIGWNLVHLIGSKLNTIFVYSQLKHHKSNSNIDGWWLLSFLRAPSLLVMPYSIALWSSIGVLPFGTCHSNFGYWLKKKTWWDMRYFYYLWEVGIMLNRSWDVFVIVEYLMVNIGYFFFHLWYLDHVKCLPCKIFDARYCSTDDVCQIRN